MSNATLPLFLMRMGFTSVLSCGCLPKSRSFSCETTTSFGPLTGASAALGAGFAAVSVADLVVGGTGDAAGGVALAGGVTGCTVTAGILALAVGAAGAALLLVALLFSGGAEQLTVHINNSMTIQCEVLRHGFIVE